MMNSAVGSSRSSLVFDGPLFGGQVNQITDLTGTTPSIIIGDQGYRGVDEIAALAEDGTTVITPVDLHRAEKASAARRRIRRLMRKRGRIEAVIGHLKADNRLCRNFLGGIPGDEPANRSWQAENLSKSGS